MPVTIPKALPSGYAQLTVFALICHGEKTITDIATAINTDYNTTNVTIHRLVQRGFVRRKVPTKDNTQGAYRVFCLTDAGIEVREFLTMRDPPKE